MVFGQITLELGVFWTAAMFMEAMCCRGILDTTFWAAGSGTADAGVALLGCSLPTCFPCQCFLCALFITSCSMGCLCKSGSPTFQAPSSTFFLTNCNCSVTVSCQGLQISPHFSLLSALFHVWAAGFCLESLSGLPSQEEHYGKMCAQFLFK